MAIHHSIAFLSMKPFVFLIIACSGCVLAITNEKRTQHKGPVDRSFLGSLFGENSWFGGNNHGKRVIPAHYAKPIHFKPIHNEKSVHTQYGVKLQHPARQKYTIIKKVPYQVKVPVPRPVPIKVAVPKPYTIEKKIPVPVKVYVPHPYTVEKKVPYPVKVKVPVPQPYVVERKVPFAVKVPVEKPYIVHVPKPYPVYFEEHEAGGKHSHQAYKPKPIPMHAHYKPHHVEASTSFAGHGEWKLGQDHANNYYFEKKHEPNHHYTSVDLSKHHEVVFPQGSYESSVEDVKYDGLKSSNPIKFDESDSSTIKFDDDDWANDNKFVHEGIKAAKFRALSPPKGFDTNTNSISEVEQKHKSQDAEHENENSAQLQVHEFESLPQPLQLVQLSENENKIHEDSQVIYGQSNENQGGFKPPTDVFYITPSKDGNVVQSSYNVGADIKPIQEYPIYVANINNGKQSVQAGYQVKEETAESEQNKRIGNYYANYKDTRNSRKMHHNKSMVSPIYYTSNDMIATGAQMMPYMYYNGYDEMVPSLNRRYDYEEQPLVRTRTTPAHMDGKSMRRMDFEPRIWAKPNMAGWTPIETRRDNDGAPRHGDERS